MKVHTVSFLAFTATISIWATSAVWGQEFHDWESGFEVDMEGWGASDAGAILSWQAAGGSDGAFLQGSGTGTEWHFVSPVDWSGDWSAYQALRFDMAITSRHYADSDRGDIVVIVGANGQEMRWNGPAPLWTWTHYEIGLVPEAFGVERAIFDGIMADVVEMRILAEYTSASETVGLDRVLVTDAPIHVHSESLIERFTSATVDPLDNSVAGWLPVDDTTLSVVEMGRPSYCLHGDDWRDGRYFKIASPPSWAGDWRGFTELSFDFMWDSSGGTQTDIPLVEFFGANGQVLTWNATITDGQWQRHHIDLAPASFGVDQEVFDGVMSYVNQIWIRGEHDSGDDQAYLDNVVLSTGPLVPRRFETSLVSRFGTDAEGWLAIGNSLRGWAETGGLTGGYLTGEDLGTDTGRFQSPDGWSGDWREFKELRLFLKTLGRNRGDLPLHIWIVTWDGSSISQTLPTPYRSWTPYTMELTPEAFGVDAGQFDAILGDVAYLWIESDLVSGAGAIDRTGMDEVALIADATLLTTPPERFSRFSADSEGWRGNGWTGSDWTFNMNPAAHQQQGGNPDGFIIMDDAELNAGWFSPEAWAGDWRGYESIVFDLKIIEGTVENLLEPGWMVAVISPHGNLFQDCAEVPIPQEWKHYEFALTPEAFGVSRGEFEMKMRDAIAISIRSEWINNVELEGLDNVRLSKAPEAYWNWISGYLTPVELEDELISGKWADADQDGASNWEEYVALTAPDDPLSRFDVRVERTVDGFEIGYFGRVGRLYQVWKTADLSDPESWIVVGPMEPGEDAMRTYMDPAVDPAAFFRVGIRIP